MLRAIYEIFDYAPKWVKVCTALLSLVFAILFFAPYIKDLKYLSATHEVVSGPSFIDRAKAAKEYLRYSYRTFMHDGVDSESPPMLRNRAFIKGLDREGGIHLDVYTLEGKKPARGLIADVKIHDKNLALAIINKEANNAVIVDTYQHLDQLYFVVWLNDGSPLNERLILNSAGTPIKTPPTNIVNRLFKEHYRMVAFN